MKKQIVLLSATLAVSVGYSAGFGLYEASARGNALGGALVGSTKDASAVYYNPANMTETTNVSVMVGGTFTWVYADVAVDRRSQKDMDPGLFFIPHFYVTTPVWGDLYFGLGLYCENGLGTKYGNHWDLAGDTIETTLEQFTLNPSLAYEIADWWSVGAGMRVSYITFFSRKHPYAGTPGYDLTSTMEGNDITLGYDIGTSFTLFKSRDYGTLKLGAVYRSQLRHNIEGNFHIKGNVPNPYTGKSISYESAGGDTHSYAGAKLHLPQSVSTGLNWDSPGNKWHAGLAVTWTEWSSVDTIGFKLPARKPVTREPNSFYLPLKWDDVWRFAFGLEYDVTDDLSLRGGYVYDMDPTSSHHGTTMLPGGHRNIFGLGFGYKIWRTLRLDLGYNLIMMDDSNRAISVNGKMRDFEVTNGYSQMLSMSLSYTF